MSPSELLLGHRPKCRLDLLKPTTADRVEANQWKQKQQHDARCIDRCLKEGDTVFVKNFQSSNAWLPGVIKKKTAPVSFIVKLSDGRERRCHQHQLQKRTVEVIVEDPIELETPTPPVTQSSSPVSDKPLVEVPSTSDTAEQTAGPPVPIRQLEEFTLRDTVQLYTAMNLPCD